MSYAGEQISYNNIDPQRHICSLSDTTQDWVQRAPELVKQIHPTPLGTPSEEQPFIFFHVRKAGGSAIRSYLLRAADKLRLKHFIVCFDIGCQTYHLPNNATYAVYAAHFYYANALNRLQYATPKLDRPKIVNMNRKPFDCIVSLRPTISRVTSCWNYRYSQELKATPPIHNRTAEELEEELPTFYSLYREGCNNENIRVFGNVQHEQRVNTWFVNDTTSSLEELCMAKSELDTVASRLSQCIITLNGRCEDNRAVVEHYIPWFAPYFACDNRDNFSDKIGIVHKAPLQSGAEEVILRQNQLDEYIYQFGVAFFEAQLKVAKEAIAVTVGSNYTAIQN